MKVIVPVVLCIIGACALLILLIPWNGEADDSADSTSAPGRAETSGPSDTPQESPLSMMVPPLDCIPSEIDGQGSATVTPSEPVRIGSTQKFEITFTTGDDGIAPGGFVILQVSPYWEWSRPHSLYPGRMGYTEVTCAAEDPSLKVYTLQLNRILVVSTERGFKPGEEITFRYGPARVDKFAEREELFQIFVDADGDGHYACIADTPSIEILPYPPARLAVSCPSRCSPGDAIRIKAAPLDFLGNWSELPAGEYGIRVLGNMPGEGGGEEGDGSGADAGAQAKAQVETESMLELGPGEKTVEFKHTPGSNGIYFFEVEGPDGLVGLSNVLYCRKGTPSLNLYFGDIHGHTRLSDGTGTPEDYYLFAREVSGLDIAALTDHADYGTMPLKGAPWDRIKRAASAAHDPGRFVTFLAFEWTNWEYGHRNVYYRDGDGPVIRSIDEESNTPQELWKLIEPYEAMTIAHHVGGGPVPTDWSVEPGQMERLVEICSIHGSSEYYGGEKCIYRPVKGAFVRDALGKGYKLGIMASGDTHDGHPGKRTAGTPATGIMGVFAPTLTREAVWDAMKKRHVYGTSGPKIILFFRVANSPMGSETSWPAEKGPVPISVMAVGCAEIAGVEIIRNGDLLFREVDLGFVARILLEDPKPPKGANWYYARIVQNDGNMAWSSPVWVECE